jgi:drug/metabolite transporter (DMT)-like permease
MLTATLLALGAAVLHAAWNLAIKQADGDRYVALWGQFLVAGGVSAVIILLIGGLPASTWPWAAISGLVHVPYCAFLALAYTRGEFSLVYPVARGAGALLAAIGGVWLLDDDLGVVGLIAIGVVATGLFLLAGHVRGAEVADALVVAAAIGVYSTSDAHGSRVTGTAAYALAPFVVIALTTTVYGLATGRGRALRMAVPTQWRRFVLTGLAAGVTYWMVVVAFRYAPVGYVTALRESSVVLAAFVGWRLLGEQAGRRRVVAASIVLAGLVLLVASR